MKERRESEKKRKGREGKGRTQGRERELEIGDRRENGR